MQKLYKLFVVDLLLKNIGFLAVHLISKQDIQRLQSQSNELVKLLGKDTKNISDSLGVHESMIKAPIAHDWVKYNTYDNFGELTNVNAKL